jgi:SpoIID/LytB domain protein
MMKNINLFAMLLALAVPAFSSPLSQANTVYFSSGPLAAANLYYAALQTDKSPQAFLNAAYVARETGDIDKAVALITQALAAHPADTQIMDYAGSLYLSKGDFLKARIVIERRLKKPDARPIDNLNLALAFIGIGDNKAAEWQLHRAIAQDPHFTLAFYFLGKVLDSEGRPAEAAKAYEETVKFDSQFLEARRALADALYIQNNYDDAWMNYSKVSFAAPDDEFLKQRVAELSGKITKKPEELLPPKVLEHVTHVPPIKAPGSPLLRVGISSDMKGEPVKRSSVGFTPSGQFLLLNGANGKKVAEGTAGDTWRIEVSTPDFSAAKVYDSSGTTVFQFSGSVIIHQAPKYPHTVILRGLAAGAGTAWASVSDKEVRGDVEISLNRKLATIVIVNHVNLEEYVSGVLAAEMPVTYPDEALKAQAVLVRTYALHAMGTHSELGYDICDEQHCQVYAGVKAESPKSIAAAEATKGKILAYNGKPIAAYFSSNCGGFSQDGSASGWAAQPYLQVVSDYLDTSTPPDSPYGFVQLLQYTPEAYCGAASTTLVPGDPQFRWERAISADDLRARVARIKDIGAIKAVIQTKRSTSGHTDDLLIRGETGDLTVENDYPIRKLLGLGGLRSSNFVIETMYGPENKPQQFVLYGGGWGHGVGFCQTGAKGRATAGETYPEILAHYYPEAKLDDAARYMTAGEKKAPAPVQPKKARAKKWHKRRAKKVAPAPEG